MSGARGDGGGGGQKGWEARCLLAAARKRRSPQERFPAPSVGPRKRPFPFGWGMPEGRGSGGRRAAGAKARKGPEGGW